jgi:DNA-binding response OmpR family regulator
MAVEDDERIRRLIETVLAGEGYDVVSAGSGDEALRLLDEAKPQVILLDLMMPGLDGWAFLRTIREQGVRSPVVLVSAVRDLPAEARRLGADSLPKPFAVEDLIAKVEEHLGHARAGRA